jgi:hypothetical protein
MIDSINFKPDENAVQRHSFDEWVQVQCAPCSHEAPTPSRLHNLVQVQPTRARKSASGGDKDERLTLSNFGTAKNSLMYLSGAKCEEKSHFL